MAAYALPAGAAGAIDGCTISSKSYSSASDTISFDVCREGSVDAPPLAIDASAVAATMSAVVAPASLLSAVPSKYQTFTDVTIDGDVGFEGSAEIASALGGTDEAKSALADAIAGAIDVNADAVGTGNSWAVGPPRPPPSAPPMLATPTVLAGSFTIAGDVEVVCDATFKEAVAAVIRLALGGGIDADVTVTCDGGSVVVSYLVVLPAGTLVAEAAAAQESLGATFSNATTTEAALQAGGLVVDVEAIVAPDAAASPSPPPPAVESPADVEPPPSPPATETTIESFNGTVTTPILLPVIIGIVVGVTGLCVCVLVVICIAVVCCLRKRRSHSAPSSAAAKYYQNRGPAVTVEKGQGFEQGALVTTNFTAVTSKI